MQKENPLSIIIYSFSLDLYSSDLLKYIKIDMLYLSYLDTVQENHENWQNDSKNVHFIPYSSQILICHIFLNDVFLLLLFLRKFAYLFYTENRPVQAGVGVLSCQFQQLHLKIWRTFSFSSLYLKGIKAEPGRLSDALRHPH